MTLVVVVVRFGAGVNHLHITWCHVVTDTDTLLKFKQQTCMNRQLN